ncbi:MAG: YjjG family noncanonical pyrimidine nucleotidase [Bacteroidales bacterium]|nr:YjjG family noncanonical pyrimidine nucleotidase [Bacteroidales bacterium]
MKRYKHIYFDLDRTLWDFENNSRTALKRIFKKYGLFSEIDDFDLFLKRYAIHNDRLWESYRKGQIKKNELRTTRFKNTLNDFGIKDIRLAKLIDENYIIQSPHGKHLVPNAIDILEYLKNNYSLYIITNGFKEVQYLKLQNSGLIKYFNTIFTSDKVGSSKPEKRFFQVALSTVNASKKESLVIGDDLEIDIIGARNFGIDQIYFNPDSLPHTEEVTYEIRSLKEIEKIL